MCKHAFHRSLSDWSSMILGAWRILWSELGRWFYKWLGWVNLLSSTLASSIYVRKVARWLLKLLRKSFEFTIWRQKQWTQIQEAWSPVLALPSLKYVTHPLLHKASVSLSVKCRRDTLLSKVFQFQPPLSLYSVFRTLCHGLVSLLSEAFPSSTFFRHISQLYGVGKGD